MPSTSILVDGARTNATSLEKHVARCLFIVPATSDIKDIDGSSLRASPVVPGGCSGKNNSGACSTLVMNANPSSGFTPLSSGPPNHEHLPLTTNFYIS